MTVVCKQIATPSWHDVLEDSGREQDVERGGETEIVDVRHERFDQDAGIGCKLLRLLHAFERGIEGRYVVAVPGEEDGVAAFTTADVKKLQRTAGGEYLKNPLTHLRWVLASVVARLIVTLVV